MPKIWQRISKRIHDNKDAGEFGLRSSLGIYFWHQYRIYHTLIFLKIWKSITFSVRYDTKVIKCVHSDLILSDSNDKWENQFPKSLKSKVFLKYFIHGYVNEKFIKKQSWF